MDNYTSGTFPVAGCTYGSPNSGGKYKRGFTIYVIFLAGEQYYRLF